MNYEKQETGLTLPFCGEMRQDKHFLAVRVYYADTDFSGLVYHGRYLEFFERGRSEFLRLHDIHHHLMLEAQEGQAFAWIVRRMSLDFASPARIDDILQVVTRIDEVRPARVLMAQQIWREEKLLVSANVEVALINASGRPRRQFPKSVKRFSDKNCGKNKGLEQERDSEIAHSALARFCG